MKINSDNSSDSHLEIIQLLPWYVNKSLTGQELKSVESHLGTCLVCKRELMQLEKLADAVNNDSSFDSAENASFARLKQRIHSDQRRLTKTFSPEKNKTAGTLFNFPKASRSSMTTSAWAIAAMLLLALLVPLNLLKTGSLTTINQYKTLSDGQSEKLKSTEIRVVFTENLDENHKDLIIANIRGHIIGKPSPQGVYTVSLPDAMTQSGILTAIGELRKDNRVIFAEPAYALLSAAQAGEAK